MFVGCKQHFYKWTNIYEISEKVVLRTRKIQKSIKLSRWSKISHCENISAEVCLFLRCFTCRTSISRRVKTQAWRFLSYKNTEKYVFCVKCHINHLKTRMAWVRQEAQSDGNANSRFYHTKSFNVCNIFTVLAQKCTRSLNNFILNLQVWAKLCCVCCMQERGGDQQFEHKAREWTESCGAAPEKDQRTSG